ncbi:MAG: signal peptidase II [Lachnospirales bacterium]
MFIYLLIILVLVGLDQLTKYLAIVHLMGSPSITFIPKILNFTYVENRGAAWGMFSNSTFMLSIVSLVIMVLIMYLIIKRDKYFTFKYIDYVLVLIFSGALGNFLDRFFRTYVVDFLEFGFMDFPVFNFADVYVVVGAFLMAIITLFLEKENEKDDK